MDKTVETLDDYVKLLLYGHIGAGKTRFCADAPKPEWWDSERSATTLKYWPEYKNIPIKIPADFDELQRGVEKAIKSPEVETIVFDTVSSSLNKFIRDYVKKQVATNTKRSDVNEIWESDYKYATQAFGRLFADLQEAPINVVIIAHRRVIRQEGTGKILQIVPDVTPKLQDVVEQLINVVAYMEATPSNFKGMRRRLYVNPTDTIEAKNRLNIQDQYIDDPEWKKVFS